MFARIRRGSKVHTPFAHFLHPQITQIKHAPLNGGKLLHTRQDIPSASHFPCPFRAEDASNPRNQNVNLLALYGIVMFIRFMEYLRLVRFSHTLFALPFVVLATGMAVAETGYSLRFADLIGILLCMVFARSAAMGFNRYADQKIDAENPRTASRHLPAGILSPQNVWAFIAVCSIGFVLSTLLFLPNTIPVIAAVPVLAFLFGYSYAKRFTTLAHFWLGAALMLSPLAAWVVIRPELVPVPLPPIFLGGGVLFWTAGFDLIYACQDAEVDARTGLFSVPGHYGIPAALRLAACSHFVALVFFGMLPLLFPLFGHIFFIGVCCVGLIFIAEHLLARPRRNKPLDLDRVNIAFFQMNVVVSLGLMTVGLIDLAW